MDFPHLGKRLPRGNSMFIYVGHILCFWPRYVMHGPGDNKDEAAMAFSVKHYLKMPK